MAAAEIKNPVYSGYFSDPFAWKQDERYYAFGGGEGEPKSTRSGVFPLLESRDLLHWIPMGEALTVLDPAYGTDYWAPEIAFRDGCFWMYYSLGFGDKGHHLRVAASSEAKGRYADTGALLTNPFHCPFAIDPSPFQDDDGSWYLFYASDFLDTCDGARVGTGVVVDRLINPTQLAGEPRVVVRAHQDWQRFTENRIIYGAVYDWHTLEGPCVRKRNGRYWCLYSAGRWENDTYGIDYAVSDHVLGPYVTGDNSSGPRVLRTIPGVLSGPGHNSV
ncbi:MAG: glycoside hydrolase family 43 protein, partial [Bryobacteraceae bacterium]